MESMVEASGTSVLISYNNDNDDRELKPIIGAFFIIYMMEAMPCCRLLLFSLFFFFFFLLSFILLIFIITHAWKKKNREKEHLFKDMHGTHGGIGLPHTFRIVVTRWTLGGDNYSDAGLEKCWYCRANGSTELPGAQTYAASYFFGVARASISNCSHTSLIRLDSSIQPFLSRTHGMRFSTALPGEGGEGTGVKKYKCFWSGWSWDKAAWSAAKNRR